MRRRFIRFSARARNSQRDLAYGLVGPFRPIAAFGAFRYEAPMRIDSQLGQGSPVFSFEFFPPKTDAGEETLFRTIDALRPLRPSFVSVTYGAGGSTRAKSVELSRRIKESTGIEVMAHLTCVGANRAEIGSVLDDLAASGIENLLPLRGDPPKDQRHFVASEGGFRYASELVEFIQSRNSRFCLAGACYPEGHVEAENLETDVRNLRKKVQAGVKFLITQLFFDNRHYHSFVTRCHANGIDLPIIPGIMPITNYAQIDRMTSMSGASIPSDLRSELQAAGDETAVRQIGIRHAVEQCRELLAHGAPGIHFYTLNQSPATRTILETLRA